ncbi:MAG TPA: AAA family ATPase [Actinomycetes bacterium]|jgi:hypothetical protein|nr:AAA family ATPase [Actinomycetes bacterium]
MSTESSQSERGAPWLEEVANCLCVNSQIVLYGNIRDRYLVRGADGTLRLVGMLEALWSRLEPLGWRSMVVYNPVDGVRAFPATPEALASAAEAVKVKLPAEPVPLEQLATLLRAVAGHRAARAAIVLDYASRLVPDIQHLAPAEHRFFATCEKLSRDAAPLYAEGSGSLFNPVIWLLDSQRDVPSFLIAGNESVRMTAVPLPDIDTRLDAARLLGGSFPAAPAGDDGEGNGDGDPEHRIKRFAEVTEGMALESMVAITRMAVRMGCPLRRVEDAARSYRVGVTENPWSKPAVRKRIADASSLTPEGPDDSSLTSRVLGQEEAIRRSLDIIMRSATGLTGALSSGQATRPRGVLFFAGPTGVGKTELAKALTHMVFGDERAYIRFDMSEFAAEQAEARLIGAPPGYVGFNAGGELTNAVRRQPFSVLLFDEIEKAHPSILDKFLQVLDDGRLTDGAGSTVYFTEALLIFTSNLGVVTAEGPVLRPETPREEVERRIVGAIKDHFINTLHRPELLNRLGDNIVVFHFIQPDVAARIVDLLLRRVAARVFDEHKVKLELADLAREKLVERATADLTLGGRGIRNAIETTLVNPLSRELFVRPPVPGSVLRIEDVSEVESNWRLDLSS